MLFSSVALKPSLHVKMAERVIFVTTLLLTNSYTHLIILVINMFSAYP